MSIQQLLGKNDIIWLHYGRSQKHPKSDIPDALQKATNVQLFPRQVTFWRVRPRMQNSCQIAIFMLVALVAATPNCPVSTVGLEALYTTTALSTIIITGTPETKNTVTSANYMTVAVTNQLGNDVSLSFGSNAGGPSPVGNPSPTVLHDNGFTQYAFPTGWAGRIYVGPNLNPDGSKIEGSYTGPPNIDVSYVDGYSVPITCSSEGIAVSGCNIDLFKQPSISCNDQVDGPVCLNSAQNIANGPAPPFSQPVPGQLTPIQMTTTPMLATSRVPWFPVILARHAMHLHANLNKIIHPTVSVSELEIQNSTSRKGAPRHHSNIATVITRRDTSSTDRSRCELLRHR